MPGFFDGLLADSSQPSGGFLMRLLDPSSAAAMSTSTPVPLPNGPTSGLLGNSRLAEAIRGGFAGAAQAQGYKGLNAFLAGAAAGSLAAQRRRQQQTQAELYNQRLGMPGDSGLVDPFADMPLTLKQTIRRRAAYDPEGARAMARQWLLARPSSLPPAPVPACESCAKSASRSAN
jgi:hypothetical protein